MKASASFPHSMTITVVEQDPVAVVVAGGHRTVVSGDGTLLPNVTASSSLPTITMTVAPGGTTLSGAPLQEAELLADAPYALLSRIASTTDQLEPRPDRGAARRAAAVLRRLRPADRQVEFGDRGAGQLQLGRGRRTSMSPIRLAPPRAREADANPQVELYPTIRPKSLS